MRFGTHEDLPAAMEIMGRRVDNEMRPHRSLYAAVIWQAVEDAKIGGCISSALAAQWLMESESAELMLRILDIDAVWFREKLLSRAWFRKAYHPGPIAEARLLNPLLRGAA
jgi:hypothetical protein